MNMVVEMGQSKVVYFLSSLMEEHTMDVLNLQIKNMIPGVQLLWIPREILSKQIGHVVMISVLFGKSWIVNFT